MGAVPMSWENVKMTTDTDPYTTEVDHDARQIKKKNTEKGLEERGGEEGRIYDYYPRYGFC